jgi:drug/metabolite transporter (DMT)-like permease
VQLSVQHKDRVSVPDWLGVGAIVLGVALLVFSGRKS